MGLHHHHGAMPGLAAPERAHVNPAGLAPAGSPGAAPAGLIPPHKDEAHRLAGAAGLRDQDKADSPDCADDLAGDQPGAIDCKRFATLRARLALVGWGLIRTDPSDGAPSYFATRWNMPRELVGLAAVESFADRVGAPK